MKTCKILGSMVLTLALVMSLLVGCGSSGTPSSYTLKGETLIEQTGTDNSYRGGEMELAEGGTAVFTYYSRPETSEERSATYVWTGTWEQNEDGSVNISFASEPDDGGHGEYEGVETQILLEEGELSATVNSDKKLCVEVSVQTELITYSLTQYTAIELIAQ